MCKFTSRKNNIIMIGILIILFFSVFSDLLRIPGTSLTFFRLLIPIALLYVMIYPSIFKKFLIVFFFFFFLNCILNLIFYKCSEYPVIFDVMEYIKYNLLYISIFLVFTLIYCLKKTDDEKFEEIFIRFLMFTGVILIIVLFVNFYAPKFFGEMYIDNLNNYGCYVAAFVPFLIVKINETKNWKLLLLLLCCVIVLYFNDSKAAMFGVIMEVGVFLCINNKTNTKKEFVKRRLLLPLVFILCCVGLIFLNPMIHEYPLKAIVLEPIKRILTYDSFPTYATSTTFRTNTTIFAFQQLINAGLLGMGAGNTGIVLKNEFPDLNQVYKQALNANSLSLHNVWLEFMLDFGIVAIILLAMICFYVLRLYFMKVFLTQIEKILVIFVISFPIWVISASGIYTQYYLFCVMAFLLYSEKNRKIFKELQNKEVSVRKKRYENSVYF